MGIFDVGSADQPPYFGRSMCECACTCVHVCKMLTGTLLFFYLLPFYLLPYFYLFKSQNGVLVITAMRRRHKGKGSLTKACSLVTTIITPILLV